MMGWNTFDRKNTLTEILGYERSGTITAGTHEGQAAAMTTDGKIKVGAADDKLRGQIVKINGDDISVAVRGLREFSYTGSAPTAGAINKLECDGSGGVRIDGSNGDPFFVETVNATAGTCIVDLG